MAERNKNDEERAETLLRAQIKTMLGFGVTQAALVERLDVTKSWLSRWLAEDRSVRPISLGEAARFRAYLDELMRTLKETQRADVLATAGHRFRRADGSVVDDERVRDVGPPSGVAERRRDDAKTVERPA